MFKKFSHLDDHQTEAHLPLHEVWQDLLRPGTQATYQEHSCCPFISMYVMWKHLTVLPTNKRTHYNCSFPRLPKYRLYFKQTNTTCCGPHKSGHKLNQTKQLLNMQLIFRTCTLHCIFSSSTMFRLIEESITWWIMSVVCACTVCDLVVFFLISSPVEQKCQ